MADTLNPERAAEAREIHKRQAELEVERAELQQIYF
jgi:hypothetical protein